MTEKELTIDEQREAIKQAAFVDELQKLGGALSWAAGHLVQATGRRLKNIAGLGTDAAKSTAKTRTIKQLENASRAGSKRILRAEDALKNPRQSMASISKNSQRLEEATKLKKTSDELTRALKHSYDPNNKKILQNAINAAGK